jgi:hypothetical protein
MGVAPYESTQTSNRDSSPINSKDSESIFGSFLQAGYLQNKSSPVNISVLNRNYKVSDIAPVVQILLVCQERREISEKAGTFQTVSNVISNTMASKFTVDLGTADLVLAVRVFLVSD